MKKLLINFGLWLARFGGLNEPSYNPTLMAYARQGVDGWSNLSGDDISRKAYMTAVSLSKNDPMDIDGPELRFAVARELYARSKG